MADEPGTRTRRRRCTALTLTAALLAALSIAAPAARGAPRPPVNELIEIDVAQGTARAVARARHRSWSHPACWTADGRIVTVESGRRRGRRYVSYGPGGERRALGPTGRFNDVTFAPGCSRVAELGVRIPRKGVGAIVRDIGGAPLAELASYWPVEGPYMAWSRDGARVADVDDSAPLSLRVTDAASGATLARIRIREDHASVAAGAFSPDGGSVLAHRYVYDRRRGLVEQIISVFDVASGTARDLYRSDVAVGRGLGAVAWSPRGDRIAIVIDQQLHLLDLEGRDLGVVAARRSPDWLAWSPDASRIAFVEGGDGRRGVVSVVAAEPGARAERLFAARQLWGEAPAWSADGAKLALGVTS